MKTISNEKVMIGVNEIMQKMGIGRDRAYEIMKMGEFRTIKLGRRYLVHEQVFEDWLKGEVTHYGRTH
jgi:excisionase family DNA binding protein